MMKKVIKKSKGISVTIVALFITVSFFSKVPFGIVESAALLSTALCVPKAASTMVRSYFVPEQQTKASDNIKNIQGIESAESLPKKTAEPVTENQTEDITATPSDIAALIAKYKNESQDDKIDGKIKGIFYGKGNATSVFQNVMVRNTTSTKSLNIEKELKTGINLKIDKSKPAVVIFHTHTTEGFEILDRDWYAQDYESRTTDSNRSIVRVGTEIEKQLTKAGFQVIHDKTIHDNKYGGAYDRSRKTVQKYLDKYPNIKVVLDVHRDAIHMDKGVKAKPVAEILGKKSAQIMIITGAEEKSITNYPNWQQNLRFALLLQKTASTKYPGLMRPVFFCTRKYNMDMTPCSLLLEMGSDANTLDEAVYAGRLIGISLAEMLNNYT